MRARICLVLIVLLAGVALVGRSAGWFASPVAATTPVARIVSDDTGDGQATTTFDKAMVRKRAAIAIRPGPGADRARIAREMRAIAKASPRVGSLEPATFAVFSQDMLEYLVPEMTFVAPEGVSVETTEAMMRDLQPADVAFYLVQPVLVHDITFGVITATRTPEQVRKAEDAEGIVTDVLGRYDTEPQSRGLTIRYFGAVLSDNSIATVREAMGRAAGLPADRVQVSANLPGPGVDLSNGAYLVDDESVNHTHK
ncbi:hypothetical protein [Actinoplanes sp. NBRC 103695]|uniref:hypothetical protein n=1 Tax=Actinoplanes sp. NBRC 103695 TaxID=3032202 RepID=UPI00249FB9CE|nr:hypothetical protein [Actinoplanes sp. NBRC 103695]GLY94992.1 hypothetical protein Acsp02_22470 [Actinoplanes sp. NBRC 103695]